MAEQKRDDATPKHVQTLERGNVFFFYRPKVEQEQPESIEDVQRWNCPSGGASRRMNSTFKASYIISINNPDQSSPPQEPQAGLSSSQKADYPQQLMDCLK